MAKSVFAEVKLLVIEEGQMAAIRERYKRGEDGKISGNLSEEVIPGTNGVKFADVHAFNAAVGGYCDYHHLGLVFLNQSLAAAMGDIDSIFVLFKK